MSATVWAAGNESEQLGLPQGSFEWLWNELLDLPKFSNGEEYGPEQVLTAIEATDLAGIDEWWVERVRLLETIATDARDRGVKILTF